MPIWSEVRAALRPMLDILRTGVALAHTGSDAVVEGCEKYLAEYGAQLDSIRHRSSELA
jgi:hypothetical protein